MAVHCRTLITELPILLPHGQSPPRPTRPLAPRPGLTSSSLVRGFRKPTSCEEGGFAVRLRGRGGDKNERRLVVASPVVCFESQPADSKGFHSAVSSSK